MDFKLQLLCHSDGESEFIILFVLKPLSLMLELHNNQTHRIGRVVFESTLQIISKSKANPQQVLFLKKRLSHTIKP